MSDIAAHYKDLNEQIEAGKALDAIERYYADRVTMQENSGVPFEGKDFNRNREIEFFGSVAEWHGFRLEASAINGDTSFNQWWMDMTFKNGLRSTFTQVAVRQWKDGKVARERFFFQKG